MCLVAGSRAICRSYSVVSYTTRSGTKRTSTVSILWIHHMMVHVFVLLAMIRYLPIKSVHSLLVTSITLPQFSHKITIEHGLPHLCLLLGLSKFLALVDSKAANSGLIKHLFLVHLIDIRKHFMDSWIICGLEHYTGVSSIHFVNAKRSIALSITASTLFPHSISHEECLIRFLSAKPT